VPTQGGASVARGEPVPAAPNPQPKGNPPRMHEPKAPAHGASHREPATDALRWDRRIGDESLFIRATSLRRAGKRSASRPTGASDAKRPALLRGASDPDPTGAASTTPLRPPHPNGGNRGSGSPPWRRSASLRRAPPGAVSRATRANPHRGCGIGEDDNNRSKTPTVSSFRQGMPEPSGQGVGRAGHTRCPSRIKVPKRFANEEVTRRSGHAK